MSTISVRFAAVRDDDFAAAVVDFESDDERVGWEEAAFRRFVGAVVPSLILC